MKNYSVTFWVKLGNEEDCDFSFNVMTDSEGDAIAKIKNGEGEQQYQKPHKLSRKFTAKLI